MSCPLTARKIDDLVDRVRQGEPLDLLTELLACVDWRGAFTESDGNRSRLKISRGLFAYYKRSSPMSAWSTLPICSRPNS